MLIIMSRYAIQNYFIYFVRFKVEHFMLMSYILLIFKNKITKTLQIGAGYGEMANVHSSL